MLFCGDCGFSLPDCTCAGGPSDIRVAVLPSPTLKPSTRSLLVAAAVMRIAYPRGEPNTDRLRLASAFRWYRAAVDGTSGMFTRNRRSLPFGIVVSSPPSPRR